MKELKCLNCDSKDLEYVGGIWVCQNCGSKFIPEKGEKPEANTENEDSESALTKRLKSAYEKKCDLESEIMGYDVESAKWEKCYKKWKKSQDELSSCFERILKINPCNAYALAIAGLTQIEDGLDTKEQADNAVQCIYKAFQHITSEEERNCQTAG